MTYDHATLLKQAAAVTASAPGPAILDLGAGLMDRAMVIDISAIESDTGNERFTVSLDGSNSADMSNAIVLIERSFGGAGDRGRFDVPFRNEIAGTLCRYVRSRTTVAGTITAGGINYSAWLSAA